MKKMVVLTVLAMTGCLLFNGLIYAEGAAGSVLKIGPGARPAGMGEAFTAVANDSNAVWFNPAGLAQIPKMEATFTHGIWIQDITYEYASGVYPLGKMGVIGANLVMLNYGNIPYTEETATGFTERSNFTASDMVVGAGFGMAMGPAMIGVGGKMFQETIKDKSSSAMAIDAGLLYTVNKDLSVGAAVQNIAIGKFKLDKEEYGLPMIAKGGVAYKLMNGDLTIALDVANSMDNGKMSIRPGAEYVYKTGDMLIMVRAGYQTGTDITGAGLTAGGGLKLKMSGMNIIIDGAYIPQGDFGNIIRAGVSLQM